MREIKFRYWDNHHKKMFIEPMDSYATGDFFDSFDNRFVPLQYTGLKDKNGVEIYEGDIVIYDNWKPKEVIYEGGLGFMGFRLKNTELFLMGYDWRHYEVIGSIYEHSELLK